MSRPGHFVDFQYVYRRDLASRVIGIFSANKLSHVDIMLADGSCLGARSDVIRGIAAGVRVRPPDYEKWARRVVVRVPATPEQRRKLFTLAMAQIGKPYDWRAILAFAVERDWREPDAWFCSELSMWLKEQSGICPFILQGVNKVTPAMDAAIATAIGGEVTFDKTLT